ncbi:hypothetical protein HPP92_025132 [Vanilla planifolia]|uniref:Protein kinase G11A n=1 Tax=Vanilla planifolia TaxID=51239 RepID=A0A835U8N8_VANPL|nr:hypothetical protein HPP92_025132 [Vanilla planifolia]
MQRKDAPKRSIRTGASKESGIETSKTPTLKEALRKLCVSQASEQAATKRTSKPNGLSDMSEAVAIRRLVSSMIVEDSKCYYSIDENSGSLLEISIATESSTPNSPHIQACGSSYTELFDTAVSSSKHVAVPTHHVAKKGIQKVLAPPIGLVSSQNTDAIKNSVQCVVCPPSTKPRSQTTRILERGKKGKLDPKACKSGPELGVRLNKLRTNPQMTKKTTKNDFYPLKEGLQKSDLSVGGHTRCIKADDAGNVCTNSKLGCRKQVSTPSVVLKHDKEVSSMKKDDVSCKCVCNSNDQSFTKETAAKVIKSLILREKETPQKILSSLGTNSTSDESIQSTSSASAIRRHMSNGIRWTAINNAVIQHGGLEFNSFKLIKRLGCGDIGTVYLAELSGSGCLFALKVMDIEFLINRKKMLRAQTEREILQILDHPFLPTLYAFFTSGKFSCLVMEYCPGGDLHILRQRQPGRRYAESEARFYAAEVLLALEYLHMLGVIYRDLKPENILVREDGHIMLSDFDLSLRCNVNPTLLTSSALEREAAEKSMPGPCSTSNCINPHCLQPSFSSISCFTPRLLSLPMAKALKRKFDITTRVTPFLQLVAEPTDARSNSFVGTHEYLAPEIIKGDGHGNAVDWWTFGVFLYELLYGRTPFRGSGNEETMTNVICQSLEFPEMPVVSTSARDLIKGLLIKEPEHRLGSAKGAAEIKHHPFFGGVNWALIRCTEPPEVPGRFELGGTLVSSKPKEWKSPELGSEAEDLKFVLF